MRHSSDRPRISRDDNRNQVLADSSLPRGGIRLAAASGADVVIRVMVDRMGVPAGGRAVRQVTGQLTLHKQCKELLSALMPGSVSAGAWW